MANRRFIDFPIAASVGDNDIVLIWQDGLNKQTTKSTLFAGSPSTLASLTDVDISALTNGQILQYNSTTSKWENVDRTDIDLDQLGDVTIVSPTNGQVLVYNSSTSKWENSSGGFVPYTGAVTTVNLGAQSILAGTFVKAGGTSAQFLKADGSVDSTAYGTGSVTSVGLTMPSAFNVGSSPITTNGTIAVTGAGTTAQYVRGDGSLASFPSLTGFVPYTGATADVNLGTHDLTAERGTFANNGSSDTLTVNHTSGSGIGVKVTKGGSNEALLVTKTSGSGNAMAVVGGRTALVDLSLSSVSNATGNFLTISGGVVHQRTPSETRSDVGAQAQLNGTGFVKASGTTITYDNSTYQVTSEKGQPNGYASLDSNGKVPLTQINDALIGNVNYQGLWNAATNNPTLANPPSSGTKGYYYIVSTAGSFAGIDFEVGDWIISNGSAWQKVDNTDAVSSVFGRTGNVTATNGDYNTSQVTENTNLYFTNARVLATALTGYTLGTNTALADTDTILGAFGKVQGQLNAKQNTLTNPVTGTGTNNYLPKFTGTTTIGNSAIQTNSNGDLMVGSADAGDAGSINVSVGIAGSTSGGLQLWSSNLGTHYLQFGYGTTGEQKYAGYIGYSHSTNAMVFGTDSGNKMRIFSDGNVSISNFPSNGGFKLDVNGTGRFIGNLTAASFIRSGGTSSQFLKADGSVDSNAYLTTAAAASTYLPLAGGTLTGTLNGTTAVFSNTVTGYQGIFKDGSEGLIIGYYTGGNGYGAIYASSLTINNSNYALIAKSDNTILNAPTGGSVNVSVGNTPRLTIASTGAATFSSSVTITDGGYYIYDTRTNLANRNWVLVSNAQFFGDFAIRQSNAKDGNPFTEGTDRFYIGPTGEATFSSSVTATSIIRTGGTSSQYLMADGSVSTLTNPVTGTGTAGQVAYWSSGSAITGEANLFWDSTNDRLGISNASPSVKLDVFLTTGTGYQLVGRFLGGTNANGNAGGIALGSTQTQAGYIYGEQTASNEGALVLGTQRAGAYAAAMRITAQGNLGLGVTPSAGGLSGYVLFELANGGASIYSGPNQNLIGSNISWSGSTASYKITQFATLYNQQSGQHQWFNAPSGTAGNAISFTQAMTLGSNSGLSIGTPSAAPSQGLLVNGNTGIGTASPTNYTGYRTLAVNNTSGGVLELKVNDVSALNIFSDSAQSYFYEFRNLPIWFATNATERMRITSDGFIEFKGASTNVNSSSVFQNTNTQFSFYGSVSGSVIKDITFHSGGTAGLERMRITSGGNVGIGTNIPNQRIEVNGRIRVSTNGINGGDMGIADGGIAFSTQGATPISFWRNNYADHSMRITSGGNVGIGTTTPSQALDVYRDSSVASYVVARNGSGVQTAIGVAGDNGSLLGTLSNHNLRIVTNGAVVATITSGGNVLIGTTTDNGSRLRVNGSVALPHVTKSANYTLDNTDYTVGFDCASNRTATLPDATTCAGRVYVIYHYNTGMLGSRYVTIDPNGSQTINGLTTFSLQYTYDFSSVMIQSNGSNWIIISDSIYYAPV